MLSTMVEQLKNPKFWRERLGLLPVPMYGREDEQGYVLLNGATGNFCLQVEGDPVDDPRSIAWSSDVGHFLTLKNQQISVTGWLDQSSFQKNFDIADVSQRLPEFHSYLEKREPNRDASIVAHALRVMGQLRPLLPFEVTPAQAIEHFLSLLARGLELTAPPDMRTVLEQNHHAFALEQDMLRSSEWEMLLNELTRNRPVSALKPLIMLLLRHSSGNLFQDVHYRIQIPLNRDLPGIPPAPARIVSRIQDKASGVYFTPPFIARTLVEEALYALGPELPPILRAFDPACGSSEFFKELIRQLNLRGYRGELRITGWDISDVALKISQFTLAFEQQFNSSFRLIYDIQARDAIITPPDKWPKDVDLVIMNPPYAAWQFLSEEYRTQLTELFGIGKPNLAVAFSELAMECIKNGGVFAAVLPAAVTDSHSAQIWRAQAATRFKPRLIAKLGSQSFFSNAIVDANLVVLVRETSDSLPCRVLWADHKKASTYKALRTLRSLSAANINSETVCNEDYSVYADFKIGRDGTPWRPRSYELLCLIDGYSSHPKLGELFDVKQGARTGEDAFIQPASYVHSLSDAEARFFRPAVINSSIEHCVLNRDWYAWFPYGEALPKIQDEAQLAEFLPQYYQEKLIHCKVRNSSGNSRVREELNWWDHIWPRQWQFERSKKIVSKYFGEEGSFAYDASGDFVVVVGHAWVPMKKYAASFNDDLSYAYIAITASRLFGQLLEAVSTHIGGGQLKLEKQYLRNIPLPLLGKGTSVSIATIRKLSAIGLTLANGENVDSEHLDMLIKEAYTL
ncbi:MAG: N-6 DNA methylase [Gallionella sp.]|nr:N-6 DNA methylase [Gallionella sp.]